MIDWYRVAEPQTDSYDAVVALSFMPIEFVAQSLSVTEWVAVATLERPVGCGLVPAPLNHPNILRAVDLLRVWPEAFQSFGRLMNVFYPLDYPEQIPRGRGSTCGSNDEYPGEMYATVYSVEGLAEAFVHEMAHNKLRYLGIYLENAARLITNAPDELYVSAIRKDKLRPMSAVFHANYSYSYIVDLQLRWLGVDPGNEGLRQALELNYGRLREGEAEIKAHLKTDSDGDRFFAGYFIWLTRLLSDCEEALGLNSELPATRRNTSHLALC